MRQDSSPVYITAITGGFMLIRLLITTTIILVGQKAMAYEVSEFEGNKIRVSSHVDLESSCTDVWRYFSDLTLWSEWNDALVADNKTVRLPVGKGDILSVYGNHSLWWSPKKVFKVRIRIIEIEEGRSLIWDAKPFGVYGRHGFEFTELPNGGCHLYHWEEGYGPGAVLAEVTGVFDSIGRIHMKFNSGLSKFLRDQAN